MKLTKAHFACLIAFLAIVVINAFVALKAPQSPAEMMTTQVTEVTFASTAN